MYTINKQIKKVGLMRDLTPWIILAILTGLLIVFSQQIAELILNLSMGVDL